MFVVIIDSIFGRLTLNVDTTKDEPWYSVQVTIREYSYQVLLPDLYIETKMYDSSSYQRVSWFFLEFADVYSKCSFPFDNKKKSVYLPRFNI